MEVSVFYRILAGLVTTGFIVSIFYFLVKPHFASLYHRKPWILFPRNSLRLKTLREWIHVKSFREFLKDLFRGKRSLTTYWSFIWILPTGFAVAFSLAYLVSLNGFSQANSISTVWQAQLTIISLSFIVLIFLLGQIYQSRYREGVTQKFLASSYAMPIIYFSLFSSGLLAYLHFRYTPAEVNLFWIETTFFIFIGSVVGIGYVYYRVVRLIFSDPLNEYTLDQIKQGIDLRIKEENRKQISKSILKENLPSFMAIGYKSDGHVFTAEDLGLDGYISDIDLGKLRKTCEKQSKFFENTNEEAIFLKKELGGELRAGMTFISVDNEKIKPGELSQEWGDELSESIYCSSERPWMTGEQLINSNMDQIKEATADTINNLNPSGLKKNLRLYTELLDYTTRLNREVLKDRKHTPTPISSLISEIYQEFYHIFEAAAEIGRSDLTYTIRREIFRISLAFHFQKETSLFQKSIGLYGEYYGALVSSRKDNQNLIEGLLTSFNDVQRALSISLRRSRSEEEIEHTVSDIDNFYKVLENILRRSIELGDAQTFENAWNLGKQAFNVTKPEGEIYEIKSQIAQTDSESEKEQLEEELKYTERKKEAIEEFRTDFERTLFVAAAWAYKALLSGDLGEEVFKDIFKKNIKKEYSSFKYLSEVYLDMCKRSPLGLTKWDFKDSDIFKGVQMKRLPIKTWLKEFYCAMGLLLLETKEFDIDNLDESDNPLVNISISRSNYLDLEKTIKDISKKELAKTGISESELEKLEEKKELFLAFHHQMEEILKRREDDFVIGSGLDSEKISNFRESYISKFEENFVLRKVFRDLGWFRIQLYSEEEDLPCSGYSEFYPKIGFISDPPAEFIHLLDQRVKKHIDAVLESWFDGNLEYLSESSSDSYDSLPEEIVNVCSEFVDEGREPKAIIVNGFGATNALTKCNRFNEDFRPFENTIGGFSFNGEFIPVYKDTHRNFEALVLAGGGQSLEIIEYVRNDETVYIQIKKITRELLKELKPEEFEEFSEEEIRDYLQRVLLKIIYCAELEVSEKFGNKITVDN